MQLISFMNSKNPLFYNYLYSQVSDALMPSNDVLHQLFPSHGYVLQSPARGKMNPGALPQTPQVPGPISYSLQHQPSHEKTGSTAADKRVSATTVNSTGGKSACPLFMGRDVYYMTSYLSIVHSLLIGSH